MEQRWFTVHDMVSEKQTDVKYIQIYIIYKYIIAHVTWYEIDMKRL